MIKKIHRATQTTTTTKDFTNYAEACLYGDEVQTINLHDCWLVTVYKVDTDGFKRGTILEPVKQGVENTDGVGLIIKEYATHFTVHSFVGEIQAVRVAKSLIQ